MTPSLKQQAIALHQASQLAQAQHLYQQVLQQSPHDADTWHRLGVVYWQQQQFTPAKEALLQALHYQKKSSRLWLHYGLVLGSLEQHDLAQYSIEQGLDCQITTAQHIELLYYHAVTLHKQHKLTDALSSIDNLLKLSPNHVQALNLQGTLYLQLHQLPNALSCYQAATQLDHDFAEAWYHGGVVLEKMQHYQQAISHYQQAIRIKPHYVKALYNCANVYAKQQDYPQAIRLLEQLVAIAPDYPYGQGRLYYWKMHHCDWQDYEHLTAKLRQQVIAQQSVIAPFEFFNVLSNAKEQHLCAQTYVNQNYPKQVPSLWQGEIYQHSKIKVAYISADFYNHATAILMIELFEQHDRNQFEIIALAFNTKNDEMTTRVQAAFNKYIDVSKCTDLQIAQLIKQLEIDIAIDLKGHTQDARLGIFAYKAAPIQVNYLGQASTIGAEYIDYILADSVVIPLQEQSSFSEKVVYLPDTYYVNDSKRHIDPHLFSREELGLPKQGFVFCCFNQSYKLSPLMFDVWMQLLQQVPHSVLWLLTCHATAQENLYREAQKRGIAPQRLIFAPKISSSMHLARLKQADLFLDTLPINAHTTACDALWAGVPVVTCTGKTFASRVAASVLNAVGLPELVTHDLADYQALALTLATSPLLLGQIKHKLQQREWSALFDINTRRMAFESAYQTMYARYQQGLAAQAFSVEINNGKMAKTH